MEPAGQRDMVGIVHWGGLTAGAVMAAAGDGDERHLRSLLFAGVILACASLIALVVRWGFTRRLPGTVTPITDAPSALELAASNERRVEELELRADVQDTKIVAVCGAIDRRNQADGLSVPDKEDTQPMRRLRPVRPGEASLCRPAVALLLGLR